MRNLQISAEERTRRNALFSRIWGDLSSKAITPHQARDICTGSEVDWNAFGNWCTSHGHETPRLQIPGMPRPPKPAPPKEPNHAGIVAAVDAHREFGGEVAYHAVKNNAQISHVHAALKRKATYDAHVKKSK